MSLLKEITFYSLNKDCFGIKLTYGLILWLIFRFIDPCKLYFFAIPTSWIFYNCLSRFGGIPHLPFLSCIASIHLALDDDDSHSFVENSSLNS